MKLLDAIVVSKEMVNKVRSSSQLLNSEFLNGENISLSNREAVRKIFMEFWPMGSK